jgi:hypothetical protein
MSPAAALTAEPRSRILVAGADAARRAALLADLSAELPPDTLLGEAGAVAEVFEQAPRASVVMLAGDVGEVSAESLMHVLGDRHPSLPVISLAAAGEEQAAECSLAA